MDSAKIESITDYKQTPRGRQEYWNTELTAAEKRLRDWRKESNKIVQRYLGKNAKNINSKMFKLNLLNSNIKTVMSMLYGQLPRPDVSRRDSTGNDDIARVASEVMERLLRLDVQDNAQSYDSTLHSVLLDRLLGGLGVARVRYEMQEVQMDAEMADPAQGMLQMQQTALYEDAPIEYVYWEDLLWGWGRNFSELPWIAFRAYMTRDEVEERFGKDKAMQVKYKTQQVSNEENGEDSDLNSAWQKAEIWEIWCKTERKVYWYSPGCTTILDEQPDPLELTNFFPCPPFLLANQTTSLYIPTPDFTLAKDLYNQIDVLQTRIAILTDAVKVVGVYDQSSTGVKRMLSEGVENDLIPVDNWALFAEKGGLRGQVDWLPIEAVVNALTQLQQLRDETIGLLQQVTGMADVMRGDLGNAYEGVGQTQIKTKFGSARLQALQEQFARFVSDLVQLKAEVIGKHFEAETILQKSGAEFSFDAPLMPQAVQLIKSEQFPLRIEIRPETMSQMDYAQMQAERTEYLQGMAGFLQAAAPLIEQDPRTMPFMLQMLKWTMAGFKGSKEIEGVMDQAIDAASQPQEQEGQEKPDPEQIRAQLQLELEDKRAQAKQQEQQQKHQFDLEMREADRIADIQTKQAEMEFRKEEKEFETMAELEILAAKMESDVQTELLTSRINAQQAEAAGEVEIEKEMIKARNDIRKLQIQKRADADIKVIEKTLDEDIERQKQVNQTNAEDV